MPLSPKTYTFLCGCFAALGSFQFGYDLGVIGGVLVSSDFQRVANNLSSTYQGFIVSSLVLGALCGCIPASLLADKYSRRSAITVGALIFIMGGGLQAGAQSGAMILAGRFFAGFGIGMLALLTPLYQSEIAHPSIRGRLTTLVQLFLGIGAFIATMTVYGCNVHHADTPFEWRFPLGLQILPAIPLALLIFCFPESPRWLMAQGREEDAIRSLARLHSNGDVDDLFVVAEAAELSLAIKREKAMECGWLDLFTNKQNFRKVALGSILQFSVQMTGVSAIQYYAPTIFKALNFTDQRALLFNSIGTVFALFGELMCVLFVDKLGRRWPLIINNLGISAVFAVASGIQANYNPNASNQAAMGYAFVIMTWFFQVFFSSAIGPLSWAYPVEIMNTGIRAKGTAVTTIFCWLANFMIGQVSPIAFKNIGWKYYLVFTICAFTNAVTMYLFFPETKGRTLEEMDSYFEQTHWIVPLAKDVPLVSTKQREEELRQGYLSQGGTAEEVMGRRAHGVSTLEKEGSMEKDSSSDKDGLKMA